MFPSLSNRELAAALFNIATLLRDRQENPYRVRAFERGARALLTRRDPAAAALSLSEDLLPHRRGVLGKRLQVHLREMARTGQAELWTELCADLPPYMGALMTVPGVGPRLAARLHEALGVETPAQLRDAARSGYAQTVWGVGKTRAAAWAALPGGDTE